MQFYYCEIRKKLLDRYKFSIVSAQLFVLHKFILLRKINDSNFVFKFVDVTNRNIKNFKNDIIQISTSTTTTIIISHNVYALYLCLKIFLKNGQTIRTSGSRL